MSDIFFYFRGYILMSFFLIFKFLWNALTALLLELSLSAVEATDMMICLLILMLLKLPVKID